jgi:Kef-type K+ transport system membrane component KefB
MTLLGVLAAIIIATKLLGEIARRLGQPTVMGELVAGALLGASALGVVDAHDPVLRTFADIGVLVLLFQIGLHTDLRSLRRVAGSALMVAAVGVVLPFVGGVLVARAFGLATLPSLVAGAALTATSVGISARVLGDLGRLQTVEGHVVLGAAIADDVVGLIVLSVITAIVGGASVSALGVARSGAVAVGFIAVALALGSVAIPPFFRAIERIHVTGTLGLIALAFALLLAMLAMLAMTSGSAMILGAFAAGVILHPTPQRNEIAASITSLGQFFVPIFFATVGASVDLRALATWPVLGAGGALIVVGALGKVAAGYAPWWLEGNKLLVGVAMIPRGEVGLIFAQVGLASGAISSDLFGALILTVAATTLLTPPLLARIARAPRAPNTGEWPDAGPFDELVAGNRTQTPRTTIAIPRKKGYD